MRRAPVKKFKAKKRPPAVRPVRVEMPPSLPSVVRRRLHGLASRTLRVAWTDGLLRLITAACVLAVVQGVADLLFDLPTPTRALFLLADLAGIVYLLTLYGVAPWRRRLSPDEAALRAEKRWPELRTTLISAVQLARHPNGSPGMVAALQRQVTDHVARLDLRQAVPWRRLRTLGFVAAGLLAATVALVWWSAPTSTVLARRALLQNLPLPTRTVVVAISRDLTVAPGETIELSARAQGEIPRAGRLEITYAGRPTESVAVTPKASSRDLFALTLPNVQQPLTYRFYLNDGRGPEWHVSLIRAPALQTVGFRSVYPAYTGLPEATVAAGNLRLLAGSRLQIIGKASQGLQAARIVPQGGGAPVDLRVSGVEFKGELPIPPRGLTGFSVALRNTDGVSSRNDTVYAVEIIPDQPPEIVVGPDQDEKSTLIATVRPGLRFDVRDDFLVKGVSLLVEPADALGEGESADPAKAKRVPIEIRQPAGALSFNFVWADPEKTVNWKEGNTFYYWIEAVDNNNVTGPGVTRTVVREWSVVSLKTKHDELTESLRKSADSIENLSRSQDELRSHVGDLLKQDGSKTP